MGRKARAGSTTGPRLQLGSDKDVGPVDDPVAEDLLHRLADLLLVVRLRGAVDVPAGFQGFSGWM